MKKFSESKINQCVAQKLRDLMLESGMSHDDVADGLGVNKWTVRNHLSAKVRVTAVMLYRYAEFFDVDLDFFFEDITILH